MLRYKFVRQALRNHKKKIERNLIFQKHRKKFSIVFEKITRKYFAFMILLVLFNNLSPLANSILLLDIIRWLSPLSEPRNWFPLTFLSLNLLHLFPIKFFIIFTSTVFPAVIFSWSTAPVILFICCYYLISAIHHLSIYLISKKITCLFTCPPTPVNNPIS